MEMYGRDEGQWRARMSSFEASTAAASTFVRHKRPPIYTQPHSPLYHLA